MGLDNPLIVAKGYPLWWRARDGRYMRIADMDDEHLENSMRMLMRQMGNALMLYEMGAILCADPINLNYDVGDDKHHIKWRFILAMRRERARRDELGIEVPKLV